MPLLLTNDVPSMPYYAVPCRTGVQTSRTLQQRYQNGYWQSDSRQGDSLH